MPQELHVLRCFNCETFQVHIVKKTNKWQCKMCGEKQSVTRVYGQGSGRDCRIHVQKLNELRRLKDDNIFQLWSFENRNAVTCNNVDHPAPLKDRSRWDEFLEPADEEKESEESDTEFNNSSSFDSDFTFIRGKKKRQPLSKYVKKCKTTNGLSDTSDCNPVNSIMKYFPKKNTSEHLEPNQKHFRSSAACSTQENSVISSQEIPDDKCLSFTELQMMRTESKQNNNTSSSVKTTGNSKWNDLLENCGPIYEPDNEEGDHHQNMPSTSLVKHENSYVPSVRNDHSKNICSAPSFDIGDIDYLTSEKFPGFVSSSSLLSNDKKSSKLIKDDYDSDELDEILNF